MRHGVWKVSAPDPELSSYCAFSFMQDTQFRVGVIIPTFTERKLSQQSLSGSSGLCLHGVEKVGVKLQVWYIINP